MKEAEVRRITDPGQLGKEVCKTPSQQKKIWAWWLVPVIPAMVGS
jgi:hypothetical protein